MKKKTKVIAIFSAIVVLLLSATIVCFLQNKDYKDVELSLNSFQSDIEYQYDDVKWLSSVQEVNKHLPYSLNKDPQREIVDESINYYTSKNKYILDGQSASASFQFVKDQLQIIQFSFILDENSDQWFEDQVTNLQQLYGKETDTLNSSSEQLQLKSVGYRWDTDNTSLQIILLTGDNKTPSVTLSIGVK